MQVMSFEENDHMY